MDYTDYQLAVMSTAQYPDVGNNPAYPALGLVGEIVEFLEKPQDIFELSDACWYCAALAHELGLNIGNIADAIERPDLEKGLDNPEEALRSIGAINTGAFPLIPTDDVIRIAKLVDGDIATEYVFFKLISSVGKVAEQVKKTIRDDGEFTPERIETIKKLLADILTTLGLAAFMNQVLLTDVFQANADKLQSRKARGVISGSGDYR